MNCPQCQERLDERLDGLRSGLQSGALSPSVAREQAQSALEESVRECSECEAELRAHSNVRLALMVPAPGEVGAVPPALRLNVRRALEREAARPGRSAWRPVMNFAWTGGAMLSALGLFLVARPFLLERAQTPMMTSARRSPSSDAASESAIAPTAKPKIGALALPKKTPAPGSASATKVAPLPQVGQPQVVPAPPVAQKAPATTPDKPKPRPRLEVRAPSPRPKTNAENGTLSRSVAPPSPPAVERIPPTTSSSPPPVKKAASGASASKPGSVGTAVSGAELGFTARIVPAPSAPQQRARTGAGGIAGFVPPPMVGSSPPSPAPVQKPSVVAPGDSADNPASQESPEKSNESRPIRGMRRSRPTEDSAQDNASSSVPDKGSDADSQPEPSPKVGGTVSVSVERAIPNARIVGRVQGRKDQGAELWTGNAAPNKPISVSLAPLRPTSGDTVDISIEQKLAEGKTRSLATTSVVVP